jgi:hypothetical protein
MPAKTIKSNIAAVAAAAVIGLGAAAAVTGFAAPAGAGQAPTQGTHVAQITIHGPQDDPHVYWDSGEPSLVLCPTAIEYAVMLA